MSMSEQLEASNHMEDVLNNAFFFKQHIRESLKLANISLFRIRSLWPTMPELPESQSQALKEALATCCWQYTMALKSLHKTTNLLWAQIGYELAFWDDDLAYIGHDFDENVQWAEDVWAEEDLGAIKLADQTMAFIK